MKTINYQHRLNLGDCSHNKDENRSLDFVLKISEGHLSDLEISSVTNLLSALARMVNVKESRFNVIKEGSTTIAITVPNHCKNLAIANIRKDHKSNNSQISKIQKELRKYGYKNASISYGYFRNDQYQPEEIILNVNKPLEDQYFSQIDSFEGKVIGLQVGKEHADRIIIILPDGREIHSTCSNSLLMKLHQYFNTDQNIRFTGNAYYVKSANSLDVTLKKYSITDFTVIEDVGITDWIKEFRSKGLSSWNKFDDPVEGWLKEREG